MKRMEFQSLRSEKCSTTQMKSSYEHNAGTAGAKRDSNLASQWQKRKEG